MFSHGGDTAFSDTQSYVAYGEMFWQRLQIDVTVNKLLRTLQNN